MSPLTPPSYLPTHPPTHLRVPCANSDLPNAPTGRPPPPTYPLPSRRVLARHRESKELYGRAANGSRLPVVDVQRDYDTPAEFAEHLFNDLTAAINKDYAGSRKSTNEHDERFTAHVGYAQMLTAVYEVQSTVLNAIEKYTLEAFDYQPSEPSFALSESAENADPPPPTTPPPVRTPLIVLGKSGGGKSAALAYWLMKNKRRAPTLSRARCARTRPGFICMGGGSGGAEGFRRPVGLPHVQC